VLFAEELSTTAAERAATNPQGKWAMGHLVDLLARIQMIAALVEDSPDDQGLLCPVVSRLGAIPPAAELETPPRCGNTQPNQSARWEPAVGTSLVAGDLEKAGYWLRHTTRPSPYWPRDTTPPCNCATRFLASTIDAVVDEAERSDLDDSQRSTLLGFAIALDGLHVRANLVDNVADETQARGWNVVCSELPGIPSRVVFQGPSRLEYSCLDGQSGPVEGHKVLYFDPSDLPTTCRFTTPDGEEREVEVGDHRGVDCTSTPEEGLTCETR